MVIPRYCPSNDNSTYSEQQGDETILQGSDHHYHKKEFHLEEMLPWNAFIKPIVYVFELIIAAVVTFGTADKLLYYDTKTEDIHCALRDSIGACTSIITLGLFCMIGGSYALSKRLLSAFLYQSYRYDTEAFLCFMLSLGWLAIAVLATTFNSSPKGTLDTFLSSTRNLIVVFSWILWVSHLVSVALAWFAPDTDNKEAEFRDLMDQAEEEEERNLLPAMAQELGLGTIPKTDLTIQPLPEESAEITPINPADSLAALNPDAGPSSQPNSKLLPRIDTLTSAWKSKISDDLDENQQDSPPSTPPENEENVIQIDSGSASHPTLRKREVRFNEKDP